MNIQQLRQSLKMKWVSYYYKNRYWLVKAQIWSTYDGLRRPSSGFILATISVLEPQLEEILPFILDLNNNPDQIISALGLNFNPEEQLNLTKSDTFLDTLVSKKSSSGEIRDRPSTPNLQDASPSDGLPADSESPTKIPIQDKLMSSITPATEDSSESPAKPLLDHKPTVSLNKSKPLMSNAIATKAESHSVVSLAMNKSKPSPPIGVATVLQHKSKSTTPIAIATRKERNSALSVGFCPKIEGKSKPVVAIAMATELKTKDKPVNLDHKNVPNEARPAHVKKACKLANWIDEFCQGARWDREEAAFLPL
ncbi:MAG: hypothetical protein DSM106950_27585 [Stigonema ocellatum SAG 48.90 = DSM 106950]|nr:hypothetical protein [Stigonema ocellatum SAG 48.90 = DSM 106950]